MVTCEKSWTWWLYLESFFRASRMISCCSSMTSTVAPRGPSRTSSASSSFNLERKTNSVVAQRCFSETLMRQVALKIRPYLLRNYSNWQQWMNNSPGFDVFDLPGELLAVPGHSRALGLSRQNFVFLFVESVLELMQRRRTIVVRFRFADWDLETQ